MIHSAMKCSVALAAALALFAASAHAERSNPERNVYFGDTHAHSELSGDAYGFGNRLPPETAYRLARGDEVDHIGGYKIKLKAPLDFFMMTDHSELIGMGARVKSSWLSEGSPPATAPHR